MAGYTIPIIVSGIPAIEAAISAVRALDAEASGLAQRQISSANSVSAAIAKNTQALKEQVSAAKQARKEAVASTPEGEKAPKLNAADKALKSLMKQVADAEKAFTGFFTQLEYGYKQLRIEDARFNEELAKGASLLRISLNEKTAYIQATEKAAIADQNATAALGSFNAVMYRRTELNKLQLAEVQKSLVVDEKRAVALATLRNELTYVTSEEGKAATQTAYYVSQAKAAALADVKRLEAQQMLLALRSEGSDERQTAVLETKIRLARQEIATNVKLVETNRALAAMRTGGSVEQQTVIAERQLAAEKRLLTVRQDALNRLALQKANQMALTESERLEAAVLDELARLTAKRDQMLALSDVEVKKLTADIRKMAESEAVSSAASVKLSSHLNVMAQVAAASRAAIYGLGTSFGIYTSSTLLVAIAVFSMVSSIRQAITSSLEFNQALARLGAMSTEASVQGEEYAKTLVMLKKTALDMGRSTIFTMTDSAKAMTQLALAGLTAEQSIAAVGPTLKLAVLGGLDVAKASDIAVNVMMGFAKTVDDLPRIVDVLAKAATQSNSDVEQLGVSLSYVAPVAETFGVSLEYTAGMLEVLANAGIKASRAGTGIRRMLLALFAPTTAGAEAMQKLGMSVAGLSDMGGDLDALEQPIKGLMDGAVDGTEKLIQKIKELHIVTAGGTNNIKAVKDVTGVYGITTALQLMKSLDSGNKSVQAMHESLKDSQGYADAQLGKITAHIQATIDQIKSAAGVVGEIGYESQIGALDEISKSVLTYVRELANSPAKIQAMVGVLKASALAAWELVKAFIAIKLVLVTIGIGTVVWSWLPAAITAFETLRRVAIVAGIGITLVASSMEGAALAAGTLGGALWALAKNPAVIALAAIATALYAIYELFLKNTDAVKGLKEAFANLDTAKITDANGMQKSIAGTLGLLTETLDPLYKQKELLETQMKQYEGQSAELSKLEAAHQRITAEIAKQTGELRKHTDLDLSLNLAGLATANDALLNKQKSVASDNLPYSQQFWGGVDRSMLGTSKHSASKDAAEMEVYAVSLASVQSELDANNASMQAGILLREGLRAATDAEAQLSFAKALSKVTANLEETTQQMEYVNKGIERATQLRNMPGGEERLLVWLNYAKRLKDTFTAATEEKAKLDKVLATTPVGVTVSDVGKLAEENFALAGTRLDNLKLSEKEHLAAEIAALEERKIKETETARITLAAWKAVYAAAAAAEAGLSNPADRAELIHNLELVYNAAIAAANAQVSTEEELAKAHAKAGKEIKSTAKELEALIKTAAEAYKIQQQLAKEFADTTRNWADFNQSLYMDSQHAFDEVLGKARLLSETMKKIVLTGAELPGVLAESLPAGDKLAKTIAEHGGPYQAQIQARSAETGISAEVINRMIAAESSFNPNARSSAGAVGIAQFMPATAAKYGLSDLTNPVASIDAMFKYMRDLLGKFEGDYKLAVAAYNAGEGAVTGHGNKVPPYPETQEYVGKVLGTGVSYTEKKLGITDATKSVAYMEQTANIDQQKKSMDAWNAAAAEQEQHRARLDGLIGSEEAAYRDLIPAAAAVMAWEKDIGDATKASAADLAGYNEAMSTLSAKYRLYTDAKKVALATNEKEISLGRENTIRVRMDADELDRLAKNYDPVLEAQDKYLVQLGYINRLHNENKLSADAEQRARDLERTKLAQAKGEYSSFFDSITYDAKKWENIGTGVMTSFRDSISEALASGKLDFQKFLTYLRDAAARFAADKIMEALFKPASAGDSGGLLSGFISAVSKGFLGLFSGGSVTPSATGGVFRAALPSGVYSSPTFFPYQSPGLHAFATGTGLLGEAGPEAVLPLARVGGDLGVKAHTGTPQINVTVNNLPGQSASVKQEGNTLSIDILEQALASRIAKGGTPISKGLEASYAGLRRQGR